MKVFKTLVEAWEAAGSNKHIVQQYENVLSLKVHYVVLGNTLIRRERSSFNELSMPKQSKQIVIVFTTE